MKVSNAYNHVTIELTQTWNMQSVFHKCKNPYSSKNTNANRSPYVSHLRIFSVLNSKTKFVFINSVKLKNMAQKISTLVFYANMQITQFQSLQ